MHFDWAFIEKWNSGGTLFITTTTTFLLLQIYALLSGLYDRVRSDAELALRLPIPPLGQDLLDLHHRWRQEALVLNKVSRLPPSKMFHFCQVTSLLYASMVTTDNQLLLFVIITFADIFQKHTSVSFCPGLTGTEITSWETGATVTLPLVCRGTTTTKT